MYAGDQGGIIGKGDDKWVALSAIKNASCTGRGGWVWNDGDLQGVP